MIALAVFGDMSKPAKNTCPGFNEAARGVDADVRGERPVVGDDELDPRIGFHHPDEGRRAGVRIGVGRLVDLLVDHLAARLLDRLDHADGARAAVAALALETPDERFVTRLQTGALGRLGAERVAGGVIGRADIAHAFRPIFLLRLGQRGVRRGEDDALSEGLVDQRIRGVVPRMPHESDAVDLGRDRLLSWISILWGSQSEK